MSDTHPYDCGGDCIHCRREKTADHDPENCGLCDFGDPFTDDDEPEEEEDDDEREA